MVFDFVHRVARRIDDTEGVVQFIESLLADNLHCVVQLAQGAMTMEKLQTLFIRVGPALVQFVNADQTHRTTVLVRFPLMIVRGQTLISILVHWTILLFHSAEVTPAETAPLADHVRAPVVFQSTQLTMRTVLLRTGFDCFLDQFLVRLQRYAEISMHIVIVGDFMKTYQARFFAARRVLAGQESQCTGIGRVNFHIWAKGA